MPNAWSKTPRAFSRRTLLAMTCHTCGEFLPGTSFAKTARGTKARECYGCHREKNPVPVEIQRKSSRAIQSTTSDKATNHKKEWTGADLETLDRVDLTQRQKAEMLNRTFYAVRNAQHRRKNGTWKNHRDKTIMKEEGGY